MEGCAVAIQERGCHVGCAIDQQSRVFQRNDTYAVDINSLVIQTNEIMAVGNGSLLRIPFDAFGGSAVDIDPEISNGKINFVIDTFCAHISWFAI